MQNTNLLKPIIQAKFIFIKRNIAILSILLPYSRYFDKIRSFLIVADTTDLPIQTVRQS